MNKVLYYIFGMVIVFSIVLLGDVVKAQAPEPVPQPEQSVDESLNEEVLTGVAALWPSRDSIIDKFRSQPRESLRAIETVIGTLGVNAQTTAVNAIVTALVPETKDLGTKDEIKVLQPIIDDLKSEGKSNILVEVVNGKVVISYDAPPTKGK